MTRAPSSGSVEAVLNRVEARAKERLLLDAHGLKEDLRTALEDGGVIRRHPYVAMVAATSLGAIGVSLLLRFLRSPGPALRSAGRLAKVIGFRLGSFGAGPHEHVKGS